MTDADTIRAVLTWAPRAEVELNRLLARAEQAERERDTLREAVADACDVAIWLSALLRNPDGASDPIAWKTWEEKMRPRLFAALAAVSPPQEGEA